MVWYGMVPALTEECAASRPLPPSQTIPFSIGSVIGRGKMDEDEFGDLYADLGHGAVKAQAESRPGLGTEIEMESDEDGEETLRGVSTQLRVNIAIRSSISPNHFSPDAKFDQDSEEDEELFLFGPQAGNGLGTEFGHSKSLPRAGTKISTLSLEEGHSESEKMGRNSSDGKFSRVEERHSIMTAAETTVISVKTSVEDSKTVVGVYSDWKENSDQAPVKSSGLTSSVPRNQRGSPDVDDFTDHTVAIPGLSTTRSILRLVAEDDGNDMGWEDGGSVRHDFTNQGVLMGDEGADWDSDSEDGLQIVLNGDYPMYTSFERVADRNFEAGSEDEDEEDLVIVTGDEPVDDQEWGEEHTGGIDGLQLVPSEKLLALGGDTQGGTADDKEQLPKSGQSVGLNQGGRMGYGNHGYHHHSQYKYVRPGASSATGAVTSSVGQLSSSRATLIRGGSGRGDWTGSGRGLYGSQRIAHGPPWMGGFLRGFQTGYEFILPPTKTVFDIDLDSLEEKLWRNPGVDATDYFNFGFNESTWKDYCKKLAQFRRESAMQSKIRVYESGRSEQDYDPELPLELAAVAGIRQIPDVSTKNYQTEADVTVTVGEGQGSGQGHTEVIPTGRAIQVEGGIGERQPSADVRRQRFRDSDAIILHDIEEEVVKIPSGDEETQVEEEEEAEEEVQGEGDEEEKNGEEIKRHRGITNSKEEQTDSQKEVPSPSEEREMLSPSEEREIISNRALVLPRTSPQGDGRLAPGLDIDGHILYPIDQTEQDDSIPGSSFVELFCSSVTRQKSQKSLTPVRTPTSEKRDSELDHSYSSSTHQETQSTMGNTEHNGNPRKWSEISERKRTPELTDHSRSMIDQNLEQPSVSQELDGPKKSTSREILDIGAALNDVHHGEYYAYSPKRQRLGSHDNPLSFSKGDFGLMRSVRKKDSNRIVEQLKEKPKDDKEALWSKQQRRHRSVSREDKYGYREDTHSQEKKETFWNAKEQMDREEYMQLIRADERCREAKDGSAKKDKLKEQSLVRHRNEQEAQMKKRDYLRTEGAKERNRGQLLDSTDSWRKKEESRRREKCDEAAAARHREGEGRLTNWHKTEDKVNFRKKRDEETRRRGRLEKDEVSHEKQERDKRVKEWHDDKQDLYLGWDGEARRRGKLEDYQQWKIREDIWREREEVRRHKIMYQASRERRVKNEEEGGLILRAKKQIEGNSWHSQDICVRERMRTVKNDIDSTSKKKREDDQRKNRDRLEGFRQSESRARPQQDQEDPAFEERGENEEKKLRKEYSLLIASEEKQVQSNRRKSEMIRSKELGIERNGPTSVLGEGNNHPNYFSSNKNRRTDDHKGIHDLSKVSRKGYGMGSGSRKRDLKFINQRKSLAHVKRMQSKDSAAQNFLAIEESYQVVDSDSSEHNEPKDHGCSKLERWMNQNERDNDASKVPVENENHGQMDGIQQDEDEKHWQDTPPTIWKDGLDRKNNNSKHEDHKIADLWTPIRELENQGQADNEQGEKQRSDREFPNANKDGASKLSDEEQQLLQQPIKQQHLDMVAKLEKRKERFKLSMQEDKEFIRRLESENIQQNETEEVKAERPARKRRWGSG